MPRLSSTGRRTVAELAQQVEVLHVARAHLEEVDVGHHQLDLGDLHDLADDEQAVRVAGFAQQLEGVEAEALEGVGRAARLEGAAAQEFRARGFDDFCAGEDLLAVFDRAGAGHDDDFVAADADAVGKADDGAFRTEAAPGELVRRRDADDFGDAGEDFEFLVVESAGRAHAGEDGLHGAGGAVDVEADFHHALDDGLDFFFGRAILHSNNHDSFPVWFFVTGRGRYAGREASSSRCSARMTSTMRS